MKLRFPANTSVSAFIVDSKNFIIQRSEHFDEATNVNFITNYTSRRHVLHEILPYFLHAGSALPNN